MDMGGVSKGVLSSLLRAAFYPHSCTAVTHRVCYHAETSNRKGPLCQRKYYLILSRMKALSFRPKAAAAAASRSVSHNHRV
jgi:hypothetical protein